MCKDETVPSIERFIIPLLTDGAPVFWRKLMDRMKDIRNQIAAVHRREHIETSQLRPIQTGALVFIQSLENELNAITATRAQLSALESKYVSYNEQLTQLKKQQKELLALKTLAHKLLDKLSDNLQLSENIVDQIWNSAIRPLMEADEIRRANAMRVQGPLVGKVEVVGTKCHGLRTEAIINIIRYVTEATANPHSGLAGLWRWMVMDATNSIWLYHHHETEKWKCLFFRISVYTIADSLKFTLESYVPFGFGKDPAHYEMASSNVFIRPTWQTTQVGSTTYNTSNTYNIQLTNTATEGVSLGSSFTKSETISETDSTNETHGTSHGTSNSFSSTSSWSDQWSENQGSGGSSSGGSWHSSSSSGGSRGGGETTQHGENTGSHVTHGTGQSKGKSIGDSIGVQSTINTSISNSVSTGFAHAEGEALNVAVWAYGIDLGKPTHVHLDKWKSGNPDAAGVFDNVHTLFTTMCDNIIERLQAMGRGGSGAHSDLRLQDCLDQYISPFIPVEPVLLALQQDPTGRRDS